MPLPQGVTKAPPTIEANSIPVRIESQVLGDVASQAAPSVWVTLTQNASSLSDLLERSEHSLTCMWTRTQMLQQMHRGVQLDAWGIGPGSRVAMVLPNGPSAVLMLLSTMSRYCAVPLSPELPAEGMAVTLSRTQAHCLLVLEGSKHMAKAAQATQASGCHLVLLRSVEHLEGGFVNVDPPFGTLPPVLPRPEAAKSTMELCGREDVVLLLSTSGTTGASKDVLLTLGSLISSGARLQTRCVSHPLMSAST